jgi:hypothetical protein
MPRLQHLALLLSLSVGSQLRRSFVVLQARCEVVAFAAQSEVLVLHALFSPLQVFMLLRRNFMSGALLQRPFRTTVHFPKSTRMLVERISFDFEDALQVSLREHPSLLTAASDLPKACLYQQGCFSVTQA